MSTILYEKVYSELPVTAKFYDTNFGSLYFDGQAFVMPGHKRVTHTIVEWWLREVKQGQNNY